MAKKEENIKIGGIDYKRITKFDSSGIPIWRKDVPIMPYGDNMSGSHLIFTNPKENHRDYYFSGSIIKREYVNKE